MNVTIAEPAQIVLRNLSEDDRRRIWAWIDNLKRWDSDPFVQQHSKKLDAGENVYMLLTSTDVRIFFSLEKDVITVLDVAKRATIVRFREPANHEGLQDNRLQAGKVEKGTPRTG